jgi:hypothetical protein
MKRRKARVERQRYLYITIMGALGGIGAIVGVFADRRNTIPTAPPDRHFRVSGVVTPRTRAVGVNVAF